jgi:hypothetical protein
MYVHGDRLNTMSTIQNHPATSCRATSRRLLTKLPLFYDEGGRSSMFQNVRPTDQITWRHILQESNFQVDIFSSKNGIYVTLENLNFHKQRPW